MTLLIALSIICITFIPIVAGGNGRLQVRAVASHPKVELYYKLLTASRTDFGHSMFTPDEGTRIAMCHDVFSSGYFDMLEEDPVNVNEAYEELKTKHKNIFDLLHKTSKTSTENEPIRTITDIRMIDNILLSDHQCFRTYDYVFTCLTRNRRTKETKPYFISERFNVSMSVPMTHNSGYFVLSPENENTTRVRAIAEYPAHEFLTAPEALEESYLSYRRDNEFAENAETDPLCRLAKLHKIRVCATALTSSFFDGKIEFLPNENLIIAKCRLMEVTFRTEAARTTSKGRRYEEWMLWCPAEAIGDDGRSEYFVSRADNSKEVFVYVRDHVTREIYLENLSVGISAISTGSFAIPRIVDLQ